MAHLPGFGDRLRAALAEARISQADLARATGKNSGAVVRWLRGEIPELETLRIVATTTGKPMSWLILGKEALVEIPALQRLVTGRRHP